MAIQLIYGQLFADLKESVCGLRMNELLVKCLVHADDQVLLASSVDGFKNKRMKWIFFLFD